MSVTTSAQRDARLDLRMTTENRELISEAAELNGTSLTEYVMSATIRAARADLLQARMLRLDPEAWDDFVAALDEPDTEAMARLRTRATRWDREK
jgi:uncharacterized protein (DUF1778 family)